MTQQKATTAELQQEAAKVRAALDALAAELPQVATAQRAGELSAQQHNLRVVLDGLERRIASAENEAREAARQAAEAKKAKELDAVTHELDKALVDLRDLVTRLDAALDAYWPMARRYVDLGGPSWARPGVSADLGRQVKGQVSAWGAFDRIPAERQAAATQARKTRLEQRERQEAARQKAEQEAERLRREYPWATVNQEQI